ncbi:MAG: LpqB family beta-propeller domain-containing protein [Woeseiaceae bacterium]
MPTKSLSIIAAVLLFAQTTLHADTLIASGGEFSVDVSPIDGTIAMDLMDRIWTLAANGGQAQQLTDGILPANDPRWSPDGTRILYGLRTAAGEQAWELDLASGAKRRVINTPLHIQDTSWHPDGERLVFSSDRDGHGLDIWETDLPTGLMWRLTDLEGDETDPAWSSNGRNLAYVRKTDGDYALMLRRNGASDVALFVSDTPLTAPSWRPDGSLLTFHHEVDNKWVLKMAILSTPPLVRVVSDRETFFPAPISWLDRMRMIYVANGQIMARGFEDRRGRAVRFQANIGQTAPPARRTFAKRQLELINPPEDRFIVRGERLFDGIWSRYREEFDVLIENGIVTAVEPRQDWPDTTVLDLGNVTIMPGLIDAWSALPDQLDMADGAALLSYGVTTLVSPDIDATFDATAWESEETPGPRLLPAAEIGDIDSEQSRPTYFLARMQSDASAKTALAEWRDLNIPIVADSWSVATSIGADVLLGIASLAVHQPDGNSGDNIPYIQTMITGMADAGTPEINGVLEARQATTLGHSAAPARRLSARPVLSGMNALIVAGSRPNGLPPGLALHGELRALNAAGLNGEQALHAAGKNASLLLGLENQVGTITPGAMADLLLISGDPLQQPGDALKIVAVVRNGRFFSLVSLLERAEISQNVE